MRLRRRLRARWLRWAWRYPPMVGFAARDARAGDRLHVVTAAGPGGYSLHALEFTAAADLSAGQALTYGPLGHVVPWGRYRRWRRPPTLRRPARTSGP